MGLKLHQHLSLLLTNQLIKWCLESSHYKFERQKEN